VVVAGSPAQGLGLREGTPFNYICIDPPSPIDQHEPEARLTGVMGEGGAAEQEFLQWAWINEWDRMLRKGTVLPSEALAGSQVPVPSLPRVEKRSRKGK
jgi:hypothetical protein